MISETNRPLYIEFNGVAGSGKTTIASELGKVMSESGYNVFDFHSLCENYRTRKFWKARIAVQSLKPSNIKKIRMLFNMYYGFNIKNSDRKFIPYLYVTTVLVDYFADRYKNSIIISDEGIVQYVASTSYDVDIDKTVCLKALDKFVHSVDVDVVFINVLLNVDEIAKRLRNREDGQSRLDNEDDQSLKGIVVTQLSNFNKIRTAISRDAQINIDANLDATYNGQYIYNNIVDRVGVKDV